MENESGRKWELRWRERGGSTPREQAADQVWRAEGGEQLAEGKWGDTGAPSCRWPPMLATTGAQLHQLGYGSQLRVIARKHHTISLSNYDIGQTRPRRGLQAHDIDIGCRRTIDITGLGKRHWLLGCLIDCGESPLVIYIFFTLLHSPIKQMWYCQSSFALE